ncbi:MAG: hypothetical protein J0I42_20310 [Bosea sp.]|uniref:hypothetical protein n=1 Tax=Bosea sp. (in: a-proteobacteria) TaxID=1871050 RepID=UPI001AC6F70E|nr:hypothetical protein [Bosea sp. (in: a-proteobacteria)]MBN9454287.1 hypothetical protein [Bosea sp. (in: a-proteobacteria)]
MRKPLPELRAQLIAGIMVHVATTPEPVSYSAVFERALKESGCTEEQVGRDIMNATAYLILSDVLNSNTFDRRLGEIYFTADMTVVTSRRLLGFIWDEVLPAREEDEGEEA